MTDEELKEIEARANAASWYVEGSEVWASTRAGKKRVATSEPTEYAGAVVLVALGDIPELIAEIRRLRETHARPNCPGCGAVIGKESHSPGCAA